MCCQVRAASARATGGYLPEWKPFPLKLGGSSGALRRFSIRAVETVAVLAVTGNSLARSRRRRQMVRRHCGRSPDPRTEPVAAGGPLVPDPCRLECKRSLVRPMRRSLASPVRMTKRRRASRRHLQTLAVRATLGSGCGEQATLTYVGPGPLAPAIGEWPLSRLVSRRIARAPPVAEDGTVTDQGALISG